MKYEAIGVIEVQYFTMATEILDQMCKAANVEFLTSENYLGGRLVSLLIGGGVSDVSVAIEVAKKVCQSKTNNPLKMAVVITNPHPEIQRFVVPSEETDIDKEELISEEQVEQKQTGRGRKPKPKQTKNDTE